MTRVLLLTVLVLAAAAGCGAAQRNLLSSLGAPRAADARGPSAVLDATDEAGQRVDDARVRGKVVLVDFWASWCQPCQHSIPFYRRMYERFRTKGLVVVGVNVDDGREEMVNYLQMHPLPFAIVWDAEKALSGRFGVMQLPTSFLFDRRGRLRKTRTGFDPEELRAVEDEIRLLLSESP
ncbi:MAG: TlpA family protein disulfide reductase [Deltaproteobacteria bacterium]|nr:TlpA family protein disulfide reductase [Deltaproteobacteria bacterium]